MYCIGLTERQRKDALPMPNDRFFTLAAEFETLEKRLKDCTDPAERRGLLQEMRPLLREMDRLLELRLSGSRKR
jgi:hypothetical protein